MTDKTKTVLKWALRVVLSVGITAYLVVKFDYSRIVAGVMGASVLPFLLALLLKAVGGLCHCLTQKICLPAQGITFSLRDLMKLNVVIRFYSLFLPGGVSVTAVKWYKLSKPGGLRAQAAAFVLFTRLLHTAALIAGCLLGLVLDPKFRYPRVKAAMVVILVVLLGTGALLFLPAFTRLVGTALRLLAAARFLPRLLTSKVQKVWQAIQGFQQLPAFHVLLAVLTALLGHAAETVALFCVARSVSLHVSVFTIAWVRGIAAVAALLPFSIGGLGLREAGFVAVLRDYGVADSLTMSFSLTYFSVFVIQGLAGGVVEWWDTFGSRMFRRSAAPTSQRAGGDVPSPPPEQSGKDVGLAKKALWKTKGALVRLLGWLRLHRLAACLTHLEYLTYSVSVRAVANCVSACARELLCQVLDPFSRRRECPVCGWEGFEFSPNFYGATIRPRSRCPRCQCSERHRLLAWFLRCSQNPPTPKKLLAIGANPTFVRSVFDAEPTFVDILPRPYVDCVADINAGLPFPDASFDGIKCFRVLEHILDDRAALREMRRVLTRDGTLFLGVPLYEGMRETIDYTDRKTCARGPLFCYADHKRDYSIADFEQRLRDAGFEFQKLTHTPETAPVRRWKTWSDNDSAGRRLGLACVDIVYVCRPAGPAQGGLTAS